MQENAACRSYGFIVLGKLAPKIEEGYCIGKGPGDDARDPERTFGSEHGDKRQPHDDRPDVNCKRANGRLNIFAYQSPDRPNGDNVNADSDGEIKRCPEQ